ncbi:hypothetical protein AgCh_003645 [Apium graveolens]
MHTTRYTPSPLVMDEIQKFVQANFGQSIVISASSSSSSAIQALQDQVASLVTSNASLSAQVQALTYLAKSQQTDIQTLVDSHKHLQIQNSVALGAIMGKLNIALPALPEQIRPEIPTPMYMPVSKTKGEIEARIAQSRDARAQSEKPVQIGQSSNTQVDVGKERLLRAAEGPSQDQKFKDLLAALRVSLKHNYMNCKKALGKNINFVRAVVVKIDNFLEKRIVMNINNCGVDRCLQVTLEYLQTLRASELDIMIDEVHQVIPEDTQLLHEFKKAQVAVFSEACLSPQKGIVYVCPSTKQAKHLYIPKHYFRSNLRLLITLQSDLKIKKSKTDGDVEMIKILERYLIDYENMLPATKYNLRKDEDDDEQKDDQKPSGSKPSQSKATSSKDKKQEEKKNDEKKNDEDHFQQLAEKIVRVWIVSLREVRIFYEAGSFTFLGSDLMDSLSPTEIKRIISLLNDKDTATWAWRSVIAEWLIEREETRKKMKLKLGKEGGKNYELSISQSPLENSEISISQNSLENSKLSTSQGEDMKLRDLDKPKSHSRTLRPL